MKTILEIDIIKKYSEHYGKCLYNKMLIIEGESEETIQDSINQMKYNEISAGLEYVINNLLLLEDIDNKVVDLFDIFSRRLAANDLAGIKEVITDLSILNIEILCGNRNDIDKVVDEDWTSKAVFQHVDNTLTCYISDRKVSLSTAIYTYFRDKRTGMMPSDEIDNVLKINNIIDKLSPSIPLTENPYQLESARKILNTMGIYYLVMYK